MATNMQIDESACKQQVWFQQQHSFALKYRQQMPEPYPYETCQQYVARVEQIAMTLDKQKQTQVQTLQAGLSSIESSPLLQVYRLAGIAGSIACAYHGYKRHESAGKGGRNAFLWFLFGGALPFLAVPVAFAQGFAKPKKG